MNKKFIMVGLACALGLGLSQAAIAAARVSFTPVSGFELERYLGKWYEIARMPFSFENNLIGVTATYSLRSDGKVKVLNQGFVFDMKGKKSVAIGKAKFAGDPRTGHLKVSFFGPFYADYVVVEVGPGYEYALVVSSLKEAWILSRSPKLDPAITRKLIEKAKALGLDTSKLYMTPQE